MRTIAQLLYSCLLVIQFSTGMKFSEKNGVFLSKITNNIHQLANIQSNINLQFRKQQQIKTAIGKNLAMTASHTQTPNPPPTQPVAPTQPIPQTPAQIQPISPFTPAAEANLSLLHTLLTAESSQKKQNQSENPLTTKVQNKDPMGLLKDPFRNSKSKIESQSKPVTIATEKQKNGKTLKIQAKPTKSAESKTLSLIHEYDQSVGNQIVEVDAALRTIKQKLLSAGESIMGLQNSKAYSEVNGIGESTKALGGGMRKQSPKVKKYQKMKKILF